MQLPHDSMQVPTSAAGHEDYTQRAATGPEEAQVMATGQDKKNAATSDNEQASQSQRRFYRFNVSTHPHTHLPMDGTI